MSIIESLLPVIGVLIGWGLSEFGKSISDKKNDRKKFKKLLFNLLELRWIIMREISLPEEISGYVKKIKKKLLLEYGVESIEEFESFEDIFTKILNKLIVNPKRVKLIESNLNSTINELSEVYPIFAYELNNKYRVNEKLEKMNEYFEEASKYLEHPPPINLKGLIQSDFSSELVDELDEYIVAVARKIGRRHQKNIKNRLRYVAIGSDEEMDKSIDDFFKKIEPMINNES